MDFYIKYFSDDLYGLCFKHAAKLAVLHDEHIGTKIISDRDDPWLDACPLCELESDICPKCGCGIVEHKEWNCPFDNRCNELKQRYLKGK